MRRKPRAAIVLSRILILSVVLVILSVLPRRFNAPDWKAMNVYFQARTYPNPIGDVSRMRMLGNLLSTRLRLGMTRQEIKGFLGDPDSGDGTGENGPIDVYWLVDEPSMLQLWQINLWIRYRTSCPMLELEYSKDEHLINISVRSAST